MRRAAALAIGGISLLGLGIVAACSVVGLLIVVLMIRAQHWVDPESY